MLTVLPIWLGHHPNLTCNLHWQPLIMIWMMPQVSLIFELLPWVVPSHEPLPVITTKFRKTQIQDALSIKLTIFLLNISLIFNKVMGDDWCTATWFMQGLKWHMSYHKLYLLKESIVSKLHISSIQCCWSPVLTHNSCKFFKRSIHLDLKTFLL